MGKKVNGYELKVGDRVKVLKTTVGSYGANNRIGTIVDLDGTKHFPEVRVAGLTAGGENKILIRLDSAEGSFKTLAWRVSKDSEFELLVDKCEKKNLDIDVIIRNNQTKVVVDSKAIGISKCKEDDNFNEAFGIILAVASAYNLDARTKEALIDALYDDVKEKTVKEFNTYELIDEIRARING